MGKFKSIFKKFLGFDEEDMENEPSDVDLEAELSRQKAYYGANDMEQEIREEQIKDIEEQPSTVQKQYYKREEIVMYPKTFAEACDVVERIELGYVVIVDMDDVEIDTCKRIADFVLGAVYVLQGDVEKVSKKVFRFWIDK